MRFTLIIAATTVAALAPGTASAAGRSLCVDHHRAGCFDQIQPALNGAHDGDVIRVGDGVYSGGVTIAKSVTLRGAGAGATRIRGGGPVVTVALGNPASPLKVTISGVTISGGKVTSTDFGDEVTTYTAQGAGVRIEGRDDRLGATVTIDRSVVEDNVAVPSGTTASPTDKQCPGGPCPYAQGAGAGIANGGTLTLTRSIVRHNVAGSVPGQPSVASDAQGAGIWSTGPLVVDHSFVVENESHVRPPNARYGEAAGIFAFRGGMTIRHSTIARNLAVLESTWPSSVAEQAAGAGVFVEGDFTRDPDHSATIEDSRIVDNEVRATNPVGNATAFSAAVQGVGQVNITDSLLSGNTATASIPAGSTATADADSGVGNLNVGGVISRSRLVGNTVTATAPSGTALAMAAGLWAWADDGALDVRDSLISDNRATALGRTVKARGAGVVNTEALSLSRTAVSRNTLRATGRTGEARGAGVYNARTEDSADFTPVLSLTDVLIGENAITASPSVSARGGGLFTTEAFARTRVAIRGNHPDDCSGC